MINKRLLIKNILSHNDECTFYDKKESIDLNSNAGKGKFLKHICALSNSNPLNDSFLIVGVSDDNSLVGVKFIDDSLIQDIVNSSLTNPPIIKYENISFPSLSKEKSIGLLTIKPRESISCFLKTFETIKSGAVYQRIGSKSIPTTGRIITYPENKKIIEDTYRYSANSLKEMLDSIFNFNTLWHREYNPQYIVYKEQFVVCWAGLSEIPFNSKEIFYSEVDIHIINEGMRLFFSATKHLKINITENEFKLDEYVYMGTDTNFQLYPFESTIISFSDTGTYTINKINIFEPPIFPKEEIESLYQKTKGYEKRYLSKEKFSLMDLEFYSGVAGYYLICYLNGIKQARKDFYESYAHLDGSAAEWHTVCRAVLEEYEKKNSCRQAAL